MAYSSTRKLQEDILNVLRNSEQLLSEFRRKIENKYVIIFIGNTRNGKSTLVNYIVDVPLVSFQEGNVFRIEQENGAESVGSTIGHGSLSHTSIPAVLPLRNKPDTVIVDAPGFDDNRGVLQEIINALYINQIKYSRGVRFVLVSDISNIVNDNINNFLSFIETVHTIMPDFIKLKRAVSIIFTKDSRDHSVTEIVDLLITKILNVKNLHCERELIQHFVEQKDLIGLFRMPTRVGALTEEININVNGAIFKSLPLNLNETDIRFGLSKSARVALLETYLDFFDVVISLKEKFEKFRLQAMSKLGVLQREKLLILSDQQLKGEGSIERTIKMFCKEIQIDERQMYGAFDIPDFLKKTFIDDMDKVVLNLESIGVEVLNGSNLLNLNTVAEIQKQLEYLASIEVVVEKDDKSRDILKCYLDNSQIFREDLKELWKDIDREIQLRDNLVLDVKTLPTVVDCLVDITESYLFSSTSYELFSIKNTLQRSVKLCLSIFKDISDRPYLSQILWKDIQETSFIPNMINVKLRDVDKHILDREREIFLESVPTAAKGLIGAVMIYAGLRCMLSDVYTQLKVVTGSLFLFALFSWKNNYMQNLFARLQQRVQQKRGLFRRRLRLDNYWRNVCRRRLNIP